MEKFSGKYRIQSNRMPLWDYAKNGIYFITFVETHGRASQQQPPTGHASQSITNADNTNNDMIENTHDGLIDDTNDRLIVNINDRLIVNTNGRFIVETHGRASLQKPQQ